MAETKETAKAILRLSLGAASLLLLVLLSLSGSASAQNPAPEPPVTLAIEVWNSTEFGSQGGFTYGYWETHLFINFRLSANDPDQVNGDFTYMLHRINATNTDGLWVIDEHLNRTVVAIPDRPGWVSVGGVVDTLQTGKPFFSNSFGDLRFWITAWNTTTNIESAASCPVTIDVREDRRAESSLPPGATEPIEFTIWGDHDQCGRDIIEAPSGATAIVTQAAGGSGAVEREPVTEIQWRLSENDPNNDTGNFTYYVITNPADRDKAVHLNDPDFIAFPFAFAYEDTVTASDGDGIRFHVSHAGRSGNPSVNFSIRAADPNTRIWSNTSCALIVSVTTVLNSPSCGGLESAGIAQGEPHFPLIDIPTMAEDIGMTETELALLLGGIMLVASTLFGYYYARTPGAIAGGSIGFACVLSMALIEPWVGVVAFLLAMAVVATFFKGGTSAGD